MFVRHIKHCALLCILLLGVTALARAAEAPVKLPDPKVNTPLARTPGEQTVVLAGGCFWGIQAVFQHVKGVVSATSGYSGGSAANAHYEIVSTGTTGHAESVKVVFNPAKVTYGQLLKIFFSVAHNPTELDRQGPDYGTQYRSEIYYTNDQERRIAADYIAQLDQAKVFSRPIVTLLAPLKAFYPAEAYHQNYVARHPDQPYIYIYDLPKLAHLRSMFPSLYRSGPPAGY